MPISSLPTQTVEQLSSRLRAKQAAGQFREFIDYVRFPRYRNIEDNAKINFDFPITALVGPNGGGKTSLLQAIYGCPGNSNLGNFWFSTDVDPIVEGDGRPNCFIYGYRVAALKKQVEVLKTRVRKEHNPNYWEPSRPIKSYGMAMMEDMAPKEEPYRTKTRWKTIEKQPVILDFRRTMGAYDRYFWMGGEISPKALEERKDVIRRRAPHLRFALDKKSQSIVYHRVERIIESKAITKKELEAASFILGRKYSKGDYIQHNFYNIPGPTLRVNRGDLRYSDAFAGSGETAVFLTVMSVLNANPNALILLDEPETSLHPGAQERLLKFLMMEALEKGHQIIFSTHSPTMVKGLPAEAIKVMQETIEGRFIINPAGSLSAAFNVLEHAGSDEISVLVEDELSAEIIRAGLRAHGVTPGAPGPPRIQVIPGGCTNAIQNIFPSNFFSGSKPYLILDGDALKTYDIGSPASLAGKTLVQLDEHQKSVYGLCAKIPNDGGKDPAAKMKELKNLQKFLEFCHCRLGFLPRKSPDQLLIATVSQDYNDLSSETAKFQFAELSKLSLGRTKQEAVTSAEILFYQKQILANAIGSATPPFWWPEILDLCAAIIQNKDLRTDLEFLPQKNGVEIRKLKN